MTKYVAYMLSSRHLGYEKHIASAGSRLSGPAISVFESGASLLEKLDLLENDGRVLSKSTDSFDDHFAGGQFDGMFDEILKIYLGLADWSGEVETRRKPFRVPSAHLECLMPLTRLGYLLSVSDEVCWTGKASEAMIWSGAWTHEGQSSLELREKTADQMASSALGTLPGNIWRLARENPEKAYWPVFHHLNELWNPDDHWTKVPECDVIYRVIELAGKK